MIVKDSHSKTNCLETSSKYPIKYLKLFFFSLNFEVTIQSKYASQIFIDLFSHKIPILILLFSQNLEIMVLSKIVFAIIF